MTDQETGHIWRLEDIYPDASAWADAMTRVEEGIAALDTFRGHLSEGAPVLLACLEAYYDLLKELYRVASYASMRHHEDTRVDEMAAREQRAGLLSTSLSERASFIEPEILDLGAEGVEAFLRDELLLPAGLTETGYLLPVWYSLIMIACLKKVYFLVTDKIDDPVFLGKPPRPYSRRQVLQGLRFAYAFKRIADDVFNDFQSP